MSNRSMTKEEFMTRYRKDLEKKNRKKQRDVDGAMAFLAKSICEKSKSIANSTKRYNIYGGF